jgi:hypothetical protein
MDETKPKENVYSGEPTPIASVSSPAEMSAQASPVVNAGASGRTEQMPGIAAWLGTATASLPTSLVEFLAFLKRTKRVWLMAGGIIIGVMALANLTARAAEWAKNARERRQLHAMATLTPERLFARCGAAAEDVTKEVYPVVMRTVSYQPRGKDRLVIAFSRTAEEQSDWVFLSMQDANGAGSYDTPEEKIAALPCLDSKK